MNRRTALAALASLPALASLDAASIHEAPADVPLFFVLRVYLDDCEYVENIQNQWKAAFDGKPPCPLIIISKDSEMLVARR